MSDGFDIQEYMTKGVERVVSDCLRATLQNPRESAYMVKFAAASKAASKKRRKAEDQEEHIPPFLIASITSRCNLNCAGCYSRHNHATMDCSPVNQLTSEDWRKIFSEAEDLGISFILLAGGEPLYRKDVISEAGRFPHILFPVFTNGTMIDSGYLDLLDKCRNIVPILSIEGGEKITNERRGEGVYSKLISVMDECKKRGIIYGASVTVTTKNLKEVYSESFLGELSDRGCKAVIFVEYVPVADDQKDLTPGDAEREYMQSEIMRLRSDHPEMVYIAFPGDEKNSDGCVAAGRGFFHINSHGGAEPCPFSPYSDINVKNTSLREALRSPLFRYLQSGDLLKDDHSGGCVLFEKKEQVQAYIDSCGTSTDTCEKE